MVMPSNVAPSAAPQPQDDAFARVRSIISARAGVRANKIALESRLEEDLGIVGDDLVELIDHLFSELNIKPNHFSYRDYASAEGLNLLGRTREKISGSHGSLGPLTVGMWVQACRAGQWVEPGS